MDRIPKKLHLYWDKSPISKLQVFTAESFHRHNPDWKIYLYTPIQDYKGNEHYIPDYKGKDFFPLLKKLDYIEVVEVDISKYHIRSDLHNILRSDIFRYNMLYEEGGMWSDFDIIWLKPISDMNNINCIGKSSIRGMGANVCFYNMTTGHHNISVLFSVQKHGLYKELIERANQIQNENKVRYDHQEFGVDIWKQLYNTFQDVMNVYPDVVGVPYATFTPYGIFNLDMLYKKIDLSVITNNVIGVHWFNGHILGKRYINENLFSKNNSCSLTEILKQSDFTEG